MKIGTIRHLGLIAGFIGHCSLATNSAIAADPFRLPSLIDTDTEPPSAELTYVHAQSTTNLKTGRSNRTLILQAMVHIPESSDVVGVVHQMDITELIDHEGTDVLAESQRRSKILFAGSRRYNRHARGRDSSASGLIAVSNSVTNLPSIPARFDSIRGRAYLLLASRRVTREVSPIRIGSIIELAPSLAVQIQSVRQERKKIEVRYRYDAEVEGPFFDPNVEPPYVDAVTLLDESGNEYEGRGGRPPRQPGGEDIVQGEGRVSFSVSQQIKPTALRFEIVTALREVEVEFQARDVVLPLD